MQTTEEKIITKEEKEKILKEAAKENKKIIVDSVEKWVEKNKEECTLNFIAQKREALVEQYTNEFRNRLEKCTAFELQYFDHMTWPTLITFLDGKGY